VCSYRRAETRTHSPPHAPLAAFRGGPSRLQPPRQKRHLAATGAPFCRAQRRPRTRRALYHSCNIHTKHK